VPSPPRLAQRAADLDSAAGALEGELTQAQVRLDRARAAAAALPARLAELDDARRRQQHAAQAQQAEVLAHDLAEQAERAAEQVHALGAHARALREQRFDAMAAELAALLVDDAECPVCGSFDHPALAEVRADHVTPAQEREAEHALETARATAAELASRAAAAAERATVLADAAAAGADVDVPALESEVRALQVTGAQEAPVETELRALLTRQQAQRDELLTARLAADEQGRLAAQAQESAAVDRAQLLAALGDDADLATRLERTSDAAGPARSRRRARRPRSAPSAPRGGHRHRGAAGRGGGLRLGRAGRRRGPRRRLAAAARRRVDEHAAGLAAVQARLTDDELAVALDPPAPVAEADEAARRAGRHTSRRWPTSGLVAERAGRLAALLPEWQQAHEALAPLRADADQLRGLAELAAGRGGNRLSMTLSTFVLAARLEEVAEAASLRLAAHDRQQVRLVHTDGSRDKRSRAGLGLQVEDAWTGRLRDTATLSGGETFMTALSLALGLADVVTAEAGGQTIDALFVDEGFGSLDATTLDRVMDVLDELRSGGRLVGLVSHVADLRLRSPRRSWWPRAPAAARCARHCPPPSRSPRQPVRRADEPAQHDAPADRGRRGVAVRRLLVGRALHRVAHLGAGRDAVAARCRTAARAGPGPARSRRRRHRPGRPRRARGRAAR
jgi:exonuclease SbcC